jgi:hypothetical protein
MSDESNQGHEGREEDNVFKAWSDLATKMMAAGWSAPSMAPPPDMGRQFRANYLGAWSEFFERWMRSPEFLEWMRQSLSGGVEVRKQLNEFFGRLQNTFQAVSRQDFDQLIERVRGLEDRIAHDTQEILSRLEEIQARLDAGEGGSRRPAENGAKAGRGRKPGGRNTVREHGPGKQ